MFRHGTCIYHAYVRFGGVTDGRIAALFELPRDGGGFGEVQLAAQRMETDFFRRRHLHFICFGVRSYEKGGKA